MHLHLDLIQNKKDLVKLTDHLKSQSTLAVDTEFIRENTFFPQLALIQIATKEEAWLIDAPALKRVEIEPLLQILSDQNILKILHSAYGDQECLFSTYQITISPTLDTFEVASLVGLGESVSLQELIWRFCDVKIPKFLTRTDWLKRPISEEMKRYAMADVEYLVEIADQLISRLKSLGRMEWALQLSSLLEDPKTYLDSSPQIARRLAKSGRIVAKNYPILQELVAWREKRAQKINIPRRRIADDNTLLSLANALPNTLSELGAFRGLNPGEVRNQGNKILKILHPEHPKTPERLPPSFRTPKATGKQARVIDFLATYLKTICHELQIASRLVLTVKGLRKIVVENLLEPEEWVKRGICSPQAADLVGQDIQAVLQGKRALTLKSGQVEILKFDSPHQEGGYKP